MSRREVELVHVDGCPNWHEAEQRVREATDAEHAERLGFRGSPTILIDGHDPFADPCSPVGLSCRVFRTPAEPVGAPTVDQLMAALR